MTTSASREPVESAAAWRASDVADSTTWTATLTDTERSEIIEAARSVVAAGRTPTTLEPHDFALSTFESRVDGWADQLANGRGFMLLRGFPVDQLTPDETELAYLGLGLHLGTPVSQDAHGTLLGHVRDERVTRTSPAVRLYRTNQRQDFHTDGADLVGLLCLHGAKTGGESRIASSHAVYNELLARRPDLLEILYQPMHWDRNDEQSAGEPPFYALAPITDINGTPRIFYIGWYIRDAQRHPDTPRLTQQQHDAMDLIESIANDPAFHVEMDFKPGDIQLLNNAKILHAREAYTDPDDRNERRHLLRLWLAAHTFASVEDTLRGGIPARH
jgi:hypothetical protein